MPPAASSSARSAELEAVRAQTERLAEQTAQLAKRELPNAELALLEYLTDLRAAVVGRVRKGGSLEAVRVALFALFDRFTLHRFNSETGPPLVQEQLLVGAEPGYENPPYFLEPSVRPDAVAQVVAVNYPSGEPAAVAPTRTALWARENKDANGRPARLASRAARQQRCRRVDETLGATQPA